jgi:hypothetical protein
VSRVNERRISGLGRVQEEAEYGVHEMKHDKMGRYDIKEPILLTNKQPRQLKHQQLLSVAALGRSRGCW